MKDGNPGRVFLLVSTKQQRKFITQVRNINWNIVLPNIDGYEQICLATFEDKS